MLIISSPWHLLYFYLEGKMSLGSGGPVFFNVEMISEVRPASALQLWAGPEGLVILGHAAEPPGARLPFRFTSQRASNCSSSHPVPTHSTHQLASLLCCVFCSITLVSDMVSHFFIYDQYHPSPISPP